MPTYNYPGVYVEEIDTGANSIEAVPTSTACLIGVPPLQNAYLNEPTAVNNWTQFRKKFVADSKNSTDLARAVFGFFHNGGSRCYILNIGKGNPVAGDGKANTGISVLQGFTEPKIIAAPGYTNAADYESLISHCEKMGNCFAILDAALDVDNTDQLKKVATATSDKDGDKAKNKKDGVRPRNSEYAAFYFPSILIADPLNPSTTVTVGPSGYIAGVYARTDATLGVHKAPANEPIRGALGISYRVTNEEQGELNTAGVNCIRFFDDAGIKIWGARTLAESSSQWKYINVRRLFNMIEESIGNGTRFLVFASNDSNTHGILKREASNFLKLIWQSGALKGDTPEQAFFVKCDDETNPPESIDAGRLIAYIGICPVKPAEFVIFRIGQWDGGTETEEVSEESE